MSQENVEIVRRAFAEFERGNFWVPEYFAADVRVVWLDALTIGVQESEGLDGLSGGIKRWMESFERVTTAAERIIDAGDQVVVVASWHARGKASGVETDWHYAAVITLRDSKIVSLVSYPDPADALKAVGLEE
jgi:ketosteroid isomerase-like protein